MTQGCCQQYVFVDADGKGSRTITEKGFRFLLLDTYNQLWTLLREYLVDADRRSGAHHGVLFQFITTAWPLSASHAHCPVCESDHTPAAH